METVWRMILFMEFHGKISLEIVWGFDGEHHKSNYQTIPMLILP